MGISNDSPCEALHLQAEEQALRAYVRTFCEKDPAQESMYILKLEHSLRVFETAKKIAAAEDFFNSNPVLTRIFLLAALFHDVGRFVQLERYGTFKDADSTNHGELSADILSSESFLQNELPQLRDTVISAVRVHNCYALPDDFAQGLLRICHALRDADKLDIIYVMKMELASGKPVTDPTVVFSLPDIPEQYTAKLVQDIFAGKMVHYTDLKTVNDMRLAVCSWVGTLHFKSANRLLAESGNIEALLQSLPQTDEIRTLSATLHSRLNPV